jgi:hypothetical protein
MKRTIAVLTLMLIAVNTLAAVQYQAPQRRATAPAFDDAAPLCTGTRILIAVPTNTPTVIYRIVTQGAFARTDSIVTTRAIEVTFPAFAVPTAAAFTERIFPRDAGGVGCDTTFSVTPVATATPPARVSIR